MSGVLIGIERSPGVRLTRHQSKSAAVHRCAVVVDMVRDLRPGVVRLSGGSARGDCAPDVMQRSCAICLMICYHAGYADGNFRFDS